MSLPTTNYGPVEAVSELTHASKYRARGESFYDAMCRIAGSLADSEDHRRDLKRILLRMGFMPAGRVQRAVGSPQRVTPYNCFVSGTIGDSAIDIMEKAKEAMTTMRMGGGIGYDFSSLRPRGAMIKTLGSPSSGPVSFMDIYNSVCKCVSSAGNRRGAQMGVLRVDHPDIEEFVNAKQNSHSLTAFNISVAITDSFMEAVQEGALFPLRFCGSVHSSVDARNLFDKIMRSTWDWAEPGVLFIDRINEQNNLRYCEVIAATNPCSEQPLPPYGACLLGSFNLVKYIQLRAGKNFFDYEAFKADIPGVVRAMDNVVDRALYPLPQQEAEAKAKRRMGIGITGTANALELMGLPYGSVWYIEEQEKILTALRDEAYRASALLAQEKGAFPLYDTRYMASPFVNTLPAPIQELIAEHGIRNSHLLSIAPTGTISLSADNISSGIEPVFAHEYERTMLTEEGSQTYRVTDYAYREHGLRGRTADELSPEEHVAVLISAQRFVDSSVSKTCNVGADVSWERFKDIYMQAWKGGAKGCTTFRAAGMRYGILNKIEPEGEACHIDPVSGERSCG